MQNNRRIKEVHSANSESHFLTIAKGIEMVFAYSWWNNKYADNVLFYLEISMRSSPTAIVAMKKYSWIFTDKKKTFI